MADVLIVGCGLIGTSVGLALRRAGRDADVLLHDEAESATSVAVRRGAGRAWDGQERARLMVAAVPPAAIAGRLKAAQDLSLAQIYTHVSSVQSHVQAEVESLGCDLASIVGGHPLAGRETSGPESAAEDLFVGRPWAVCPSASSSASALGAVWALAQECGALPKQVGAAEHDEAVAVLSHLPHVAASALAGQLVEDTAVAGVGSELPSVALSGLAGPGLADATRLAAGDAQMWTQILKANATYVAPSVRALATSLLTLAQALDALAGGAGGLDELGPEQAVRDFLLRGNRGRALVPVKRGEVSTAFAPVGVDVDDRPGRLAALLTAAAAAGVNVEDVHVEHLPGRPRGLIELLVATGSVGPLIDALLVDGWDVRTRA